MFKAICPLGKLLTKGNLPSGDQRQSKAIKGNQRQSKAIKGNQKQSKQKAVCQDKLKHTANNYMDQCKFCTVPDIICKELPAYCLGIPVSKEQHYLRYYNINISSINSQSDLCKNIAFTPGSRLNLSLLEANRLIAHRKAWLSALENKEPYSIIFESPADLESAHLKNHLENTEYLKGWDLIQFSKNQYIISRSACKILIHATLQFHSSLDALIKSLSILKVINLNI